MVTFSLGAITIIVSVVRFTTIEVIQAWTNVCEWQKTRLLWVLLTFVLVVLSMAEVAVAIMVVSLPSMRGYLRRGKMFASKQTYGYSSSEHHHRTPNARSEHLKFSSNIKSKDSTRSRPDEEDSGSEVELNIMGRKNAIYETRRISVQFSPVDDRLEDDKTNS